MAASWPAKSCWLVVGLLLCKNEFKMVERDASEAVLRNTELVAATKGSAAMFVDGERVKIKR